MSEPFISQIQIVGFNFAQRGYSSCDGQLLPIAQNQALFSLLGTMYGGNGRTDFALPDLRGRVPMHTGRGPGLSERMQGEAGGSETVTLTQSELPSHGHSFMAQPKGGNSDAATNSVLAHFSGFNEYTDGGSVVAMNDAVIIPKGGSFPHNNMQPWLGLMFSIALVGVFPSRS